MTAKSEWLNGFEAGKKSVSGGYRHRIQQLEAQLDALMLEYCPDEMSEDQKANWAKHQKAIGEQ